MVRTTSTRKYGKRTRARADQAFMDLPNSPEKALQLADEIEDIAEKLLSVTLDDNVAPTAEDTPPASLPENPESDESLSAHETSIASSARYSESTTGQILRVLVWDDVCPFGDRIEKIAEASYAEVYRVSNERGVSIIKAIRLDSPIKAQTKAQERSGLVDEEPHSEEDLQGELKISEWLADIPGFVVYKERYVVRGRAPKSLLETHQAFHRKLKRKDPDRLQFYPSPSRYLDDTEFLVVELGDAGTALEDFELASAAQIWDIFLHTAIALARAEEMIGFEHRDLHEGNLCVHQAREVKPRPAGSISEFGYSGLEITILDYGLSRAEDPESLDGTSVAYDLEKDLGIFTSTHASQCKVYRQMRSFLLKDDRIHLPPKAHNTPYDHGVNGPISWSGHYPYTNVLWLAYIYQYLVVNFRGERKELAQFKKTTKEFFTHLDPDAPRSIPSFPSAAEVVTFAAEAGWITEDQLMGERSRLENSDLWSVAASESIIEGRLSEAQDSYLRRSPRRLTQNLSVQ
ncbi:hypothetical protein GQ53DRAFT_746985 [Thozetella sp. PMI_491]|nr:hypothetical protein GQ53DRAFT_746985 [Thozetella sp. PMI_491]